MDVLEVIKKRRSIRAYTEEKVSEENIERLVEAARWAPSAGNTQPLELVIVKNKEIKRKLSEAALNQTFIQKAPVVFVVCANEERSSRGYGFRGINLYSIQDTAAATQNLLLTAHELGIATCWIGAFNPDTARELLGLPREIEPIAFTPLGYPAEKPGYKSRKPLNEIVRYEHWQ